MPEHNISGKFRIKEYFYITDVYNHEYLETLINVTLAKCRFLHKQKAIKQIKCYIIGLNSFIR